jgi:hypothetical protein
MYQKYVHFENLKVRYCIECDKYACLRVILKVDIRDMGFEV